jgi:hypothetical protein
MNRTWKPVVVASVISFVLGIGAGLAGLRCVIRHRVAHGKVYERIVERLDRKLHLIPEQRARVEAILGNTHQQIKVLRAEVQPKFQALRDSTASDIRGTLTLEQRQAFDKLQARWEVRLARFRANFLAQ